MEESLKSCNSFIKTQKDLDDLLEGYGVETYKWGKKGFKSKEILLEEVKKQTSELFIKDGKSIIRKVRSVGINLFYKLPLQNGSTLTMNLREVMRVKRDEDGNFVSKNILKRYFETSTGKKLEINEDATEGALECLKTKLNLAPVELINKRSFHLERLSSSFPDLESIYEAHEFDVYINSSQFLPSGYCYESKRTLTILDWIII